jgi:methionyl-tRNA formyltransferase
LRIAFAGTPPFAAVALEALAAAGHEIALVLTQPDRPAGRGLRLASSAVAAVAERLGLPLAKPTTLRDPEALRRVREAACDAMVVAAYGLLLPATVLGTPRYGCLNIHASLLPRWRGAAPIQRALLAGDAETGISIMQMDAGLDTGPVLLRRTLAIDPRDTTGTLTEALAKLGAAAMLDALRDFPALRAQPQDDALATHAAKVGRRDARIDWQAAGATIDRQVRAFNPVPGAEARLEGAPLKIWEARLASGRGRPGEVLAAAPGRLIVGTADGALELCIVQRAGGRRMSAEDFQRGTPLRAGTQFENAAQADA